MIPETEHQTAPASSAGNGRKAVARRLPVLPLCSLALLLAVGAVFGQVARHGFIYYDDPEYIFANPLLTEGLTPRAVAWAFTTFQNANWHPLTWLSHLLDVQLFGLHPAGHHLMNVALHGANTILLFLLLNRCTGAWRRSVVTAALFGLHPLHVESVAWAAERKDVLSTLFWLLTLFLYAGYARRPSPPRYLLLLGLFALGLMAKPMLVTLPLTLLLLDYWPLRRLVNTADIVPGHRTATPLAGIIGLLREKIPFLLLAGGAAVMTIVAQQTAMGTLTTYPLGSRLANALLATASYLGKTFWPARLAVFYPYPETIPYGQVLFAAALLGGITVFAVRQRQQHPYLLFGWLWYLVTLLPVSGIVQVGLQAMADRYTYVPLIGVFVMVVWGGADLGRAWGWQRSICGGVAAVVLGICAMLTTRQLSHWQSSERLFIHALASTPDNAVARFNLGLAYGNAGRFADAAEQFRRALSLPPHIPKTHYNLGLALHRLGRLEEAIAQYREELRSNPGFEDCRYNLAAALAEQSATVREGGQTPRQTPENKKARSSQ